MQLPNKDFELTDTQKKAIDLAYEHFVNGKDTIIAGYAGTGKSTLVRFLIQRLQKDFDLPDKDITYSAFTGKASQVLTNKGCSAITLHKMLYEPIIDRNTGEVFFELKDELPYKLIIVDECSMAPLQMVQELQSFGIPTVYLGDPGQLSPVQKDADNHLLDHPDIFLTEVLRQALGSPIIRLSMKIRNDEDVTGFNFPEARVLTKSQLTPKDLTEADMILVGTNKMRQKTNYAMRKMLGKTGLFDGKEKVICTVNYWEEVIDRSLTNGTVGWITNPVYTSKYFAKRPKTNVQLIRGVFTSETGLRKVVEIDKQFLDSELSQLTARQKADIKPRALQPKEFSYAYAITGHKAQGSEWDNVVILEEDFPYGPDHKRWLYTCVTRAKKKVTLVRGF